MKVTMRVIAKEAGVSVATVSHVINGTKRISDEKHKKIMNIVQKYNYHTNPMAHYVRRQNAKNAALVISSFPDSYIMNIINAIGERAHEHGYHLLFMNTLEKQDYEQESIQMLSKMVEGLILSPTSSSTAYLQPLIDDHFPIVLVNRYDPQLTSLPWVIADDYQAGFIGTNHLIHHGHKNIGVIYNFPHVSTTRERLEGYKSALRTAGLSFNEHYIAQGYGTVEGGAMAVEQLLRTHQEISALFILNDRMTIGTISALKNMSLKWPDDIALIGYNDFESAAIIDPPISNVSLTPDTVGKTAFDALLNKMNNPNYNAHIQLPTSLVLRKSCGC